MEEDLALAPGWKIYNHFTCRLDKPKDVVDISSTLNASIKESVRYQMEHGMPLMDILDIRIRKQGKLLTYKKDYEIDFEKFVIYFNNDDYGFYTYNVIISINVLGINESIKTLFDLK